jgi:hypothetical protein
MLNMLRKFWNDIFEVTAPSIEPLVEEAPEPVVEPAKPATKRGRPPKATAPKPGGTTKKTTTRTRKPKS